MSQRPVVCVQGLGFVGAAMATAVASARTPDGAPAFHVVGVDLPNDLGRERVEAVNAGRFPFPTTDKKLSAAIEAAHRAGNLEATYDAEAFARASVVVVDVHCDVGQLHGEPRLEMDGLRKAIRTIGERVAPGTLVIVETTVPPGTCERIVAPELERCAKARGMEADVFLLAHSYERVMPGEGYFDSIVRFWRVFSGHTPAAGDACEAFLSKVIDVRAFPLTRLHSTTASETAKVLENSYRATTIAFMEEWGRFAEAVGIDLFQVIDAIRVRPTHNNIRQPGFGVGGYCLTKDPLFAGLAARELFQRDDLDFPFSRMAVRANRDMPLVSLARLERLLGGLEGRRVLLAGVSYRPGVGDTRYSPSETFARAARERGVILHCQDPLVPHWPELELAVSPAMPAASDVDAVVLAVHHREYDAFDFASWVGERKITFLDSDSVLSRERRAALRAKGCRVESIGRGEGL